MMIYISRWRISLWGYFLVRALICLLRPFWCYHASKWHTSRYFATSPPGRHSRHRDIYLLYFTFYYIFLYCFVYIEIFIFTYFKRWILTLLYFISQILMTFWFISLLLLSFERAETLFTLTYLFLCYSSFPHELNFKDEFLFYILYFLSLYTRHFRDKIFLFISRSLIHEIS